MRFVLRGILLLLRNKSVTKAACLVSAFLLDLRICVFVFVFVCVCVHFTIALLIAIAVAG